MNIILFDGICNLCSSTVSFLIKHDKYNNLHFVAQQTATGKNLMKKFNIHDATPSVIFIQGKEVFYQSNAIIEIAKLITGWPRILRFSSIIPKSIRDAIYQLIAKNRYKLFGKKESCYTPTKANNYKFL